MSTIKKKLLILGGNPETGYLVKHANKLGIHTIVLDPNKDSPAKKHAAESYEVDGLDINGIKRVFAEVNPDGILVGNADILVPSYFTVCSDLKMPCYTSNERQIEAFCTKDGFISACKDYDIDVIPNYDFESIQNGRGMDHIGFPVIVKPVDNGGGVGMRISWNQNELEQNVNYAIKNSKRGRFLIEKFMTCDDMAAYYNFQDGEIYLSAISDRLTSSKQGNHSPVCIGAIYPSKYVERFVKEVDPKLREMFKGLGVRNGVLNIQFFVDDERFYAYDPGFRLQGEGPHFFIQDINGFDNREMLINYALTGSMGVVDMEKKNDYNFNGYRACTVWILLSEGVITKIEGIGDISNDDSVIQIIQRFDIGDEVSQSMIGNEKQVFCRIYLKSKDSKQLKEKLNMIESTLLIENQNNENMIIDLMQSASIG